MKPTLLLIYNQLMHYRLPIFNIIAEKYDLTVAYCYGGEPKFNYKFKRIKLTPYMVWKFTLQKENIFKMCQNYDVVISYGETAYLKCSLLAFRPKRKFKLIYWSIGAPASYHRKYGEAGKLYFIIGDAPVRRADAQISYAEEARHLHIQRGFNPQKLFVAPNTVEVPHIERTRLRNSIMFIGTLYPQKGIPTLLEAYKHAAAVCKDLMPLDIVGSGILEDEIKHWIIDNNLKEKIKMHGPLYTADEKKKVFEKAYACISPNQAGLAVLESMGYGVPFITSKDAITGGEAFNIENGVSGLKLDDMSKLKDIIIDISENPLKYTAMGEAAYDYYWAKRQPQDMANGIIQAVEYVLNK